MKMLFAIAILMMSGSVFVQSADAAGPRKHRVRQGSGCWNHCAAVRARCRRHHGRNCARLYKRCTADCPH